jgi:hypothetical protein
MFAPLNLPTGNVYRSGSGMPGPKYWQQRADYDLRGTLDTAAKALHGEMTLKYTNNSPDTLRYVLVPGRAERVQEWIAELVRLRARLALRRAQLRGRQCDRPVQSGRGRRARRRR